MPRFTFKLQGVLEQRKQVEMQRQRDVATAQQSMLNFQAELDALSALTRSSAAQLRSARLTAAQLAAHQRFAISTRHKSASLTRQLAEAHRDVTHAQAALTEAAKQRKMMEKLREREHAKWVEHQRKLDAAENEETTRQIQHAARVAQFDARI